MIGTTEALLFRLLKNRTVDGIGIRGKTGLGLWWVETEHFEYGNFEVFLGAEYLIGESVGHVCSTVGEVAVDEQTNAVVGAAADDNLIMIGVLKQLLRRLGLTLHMFARPFVLVHIGRQFEQKRFAVAEKSHTLETVVRDAVRPGLRTVGAEYWIGRCLYDDERGRVVFDFVHECHQTTAVYVGRVDELKFEYLIAARQPAPQLGDLFAD